MPKSAKHSGAPVADGAVSILAIWLPVLTLIFGGCCANVVTLESIIKDAPHSANLFTAAQFLFVALVNLPSNMEWPSGSLLPSLAHRRVPISRWVGQVLLHFTISILNNIALGYHIPIPLHIIFRSAGLLISMILGAVVGKKRYSTVQITAVLAVSIGVVLSTLSTTSAKASSKTSDHDAIYSEYLFGITLLLIALLLSGLLGLYQEQTYRTYGNQWKEGLFYGHFLAIPFFLLFAKDIHQQVGIYNASAPVTIASALRDTPFTALSPLIPKVAIPHLWIALGINLLTQYICVLGVNRLTGIASALTLNLVLNVRKLVSLVISVVWFGNSLGPQAWLGCVLVALGSIAYAVSGSRAAKVKTQ